MNTPSVSLDTRSPDFKNLRALNVEIRYTRKVDALLRQFDKQFQ
jgi:hypothetical protein